MRLGGLLAFLMAALGAAAPARPAPQPADQHPAALVGHYDGHQMEMGAELLLRADGRFQYGVAYGALDEEAEGTWLAEGGQVLLTSDKVTPPRFVFLGQKPAPAGVLTLSVEAPRGMSLQYFDAAIRLAKGGDAGRQLTDDGLTVPFAAGDPPVKVQLFLPMFEQKSDVIAIDPAKGYWLSFRFEPNDLGKADFRGEALAIDKGDLLLQRFGRTIRFHRDGDGSGG
ncbi:hypothetical protein GCM10009087_03090 [Sphingomonas oligophenolica]|uniref:DUF3471 domain-containing protein n=1 Tax=Sphingomonas oligophenolica TaxID=301154 RepID=A0ABU9Y0Q3_9SPHN